MNSQEPSRDADAYSAEAGAVATEYALLMMFIVVAIVSGITIFGTQLALSYDSLVDTVTAELMIEKPL